MKKILPFILISQILTMPSYAGGVDAMPVLMGLAAALIPVSFDEAEAFLALLLSDDENDEKHEDGSDRAKRDRKDPDSDK